ncbi:MAG: hypothetical protein J3K34DRAFT_417676 [Monoraphidium minutum]|nr:MAG: hypothetical protein J3K34DRAFT_417676 [Monoraphidium minutum]
MPRATRLRRRGAWRAHSAARAARSRRAAAEPCVGVAYIARPGCGGRSPCPARALWSLRRCAGALLYEPILSSVQNYAALHIPPQNMPPPLACFQHFELSLAPCTTPRNSHQPLHPAHISLLFLLCFPAHRMTTAAGGAARAAHGPQRTGCARAMACPGPAALRGLW